jgi:hypothetical protein
MSLSPGLVNSCSELISLIERRPLALVEVRASFASSGVVSSAQAIEFSQKLRWIVTNDAGTAEFTRSGHRFLASAADQGRMRQALLDLIEIERPSWVQNAIQGRRRVLDFVNTALAQVFFEGGLVDGTSPDVVEFWDLLSAQARGQRNAAFLSIGRAGERLSIAYETRRTGRKPKWIAVDNNADGFDLLSVVSPESTQKLSIRVACLLILEPRSLPNRFPRVRVRSPRWIAVDCLRSNAIRRAMAKLFRTVLGLVRLPEDTGGTATWTTANTRSKWRDR